MQIFFMNWQWVNIFSWLTRPEISKLEINSIPEDSWYGCIFTVDLEYPKQLQDLENNYLLAPEKLKIACDMFSDYCIGNANKYKIKVRGVKKLVRNLVNKSEYVLHYINLQSYFS